MKHNSGEFLSELAVGLFMVAVLGVLVYFTIIISGAELFSEKRKVPMDVAFSDVGGLKIRDSVMMHGMMVGSVSELKLSPSGGVSVRLAMRPDVVLRKGYTITVEPSSLLGGNYLEIDDGSGETVAPGEKLVGTPPSNWMKDLGVVVGRLRDATASNSIGSIVSNVKKTTDDIAVISTRLREGKGTLGKLVSEDDSLYSNITAAVTNIREISGKLNGGSGSLGKLVNDDGQVYADIRSLVANLNSVSARLEKGQGTLGKLLSPDDSLYNDIRETVANVKKVSDRLEKGEGTLGKLLSSDDTVYKDLQSALASLKSVGDRLEKGNGTLGKLINDDDMYKDIHGLVKDVRQTVDNYRDTMPITAFTSLIVSGL